MTGTNCLDCYHWDRPTCIWKNAGPGPCSGFFPPARLWQKIAQPSAGEISASPSYYSEFEHEPWDVMYERWGAGALLSHALKYILRAGRKPGAPMLDDVKKAVQYLKHLEEKLEEQTRAALVNHKHTFYGHLFSDTGICDICGKKITRLEYESQFTPEGHP